MPEVLIQTRVPKTVHQAVKAAASADHLPIAAWLRRELVRRFDDQTVEAWTEAIATADPYAALRLNTLARYKLRPLREPWPDRRVYALLSASGEPIPPSKLQFEPAFMRPGMCFVLRGSVTLFDFRSEAVGKTVELTLFPLVFPKTR
ncbi:MAG: hypothetical protein WDO69_08625 [Pseudomonadota bacterium]